MNPGTFSLSLSVKDIAASKAFYELVGFEAMESCGSIEDKWLIMKNGNTMIGLFQGMFDKNILTFNPEDARAIEAHLKANDVDIISPTKGDSGPAHFILEDPDGNRLMFDQF